MQTDVVVKPTAWRPVSVNDEITTWPRLIRYPLAIAIIAGAVWFASESHDPGWLPVVWVAGAALMALFLAWELTLVVILCWFAYEVVGSFAAMPVSVAIILGAWMISTSLRR